LLENSIEPGSHFVAPAAVMDLFLLGGKDAQLAARPSTGPGAHRKGAAGMDSLPEQLGQ
jgi:hypothetical protein